MQEEERMIDKIRSDAQLSEWKSFNDGVKSANKNTMSEKTTTELLAAYGFGYDPTPDQEDLENEYELDHPPTGSFEIDLNGYEKVIVKYNGFIIDFFKTESGSLGMTVEVEEEIDIDTPSVDIFVDKNLKVISA